MSRYSWMRHIGRSYSQGKKEFWTDDVSSVYREVVDKAERCSYCEHRGECNNTWTQELILKRMWGLTEQLSYGKLTPTEWVVQMDKLKNQGIDCAYENDEEDKYAQTYALIEDLSDQGYDDVAGALDSLINRANVCRDCNNNSCGGLGRCNALIEQAADSARNLFEGTANADDWEETMSEAIDDIACSCVYGI